MNPLEIITKWENIPFERTGSKIDKVALNDRTIYYCVVIVVAAHALLFALI